ncbi:terminase large subunit, partial [bacterium]|nr:terminase large subunit [bacterium]
KDDIGKGVRSHIVFFNEANKIPFEGVMQFISRTQAVFIDFNPDHLFWFHKEIKTRDDCDYLELTYKDNEQLSASEVKEILLYKEKGYNPDGTIRNRYWANKWKVYGLGQVGMVDGVIFENWEEFNEYPDEEYTRLFGVDWGQVDPTSAVEVRFYPDMKIYLYEHFYKPIKELDPLLHKLRKTVTKDDVIIADSAGKDKILQLLQHGFNALKSDKSAITSNGSIMDGIDMMQNYHFYIHKDSTNAIAEFSNYRYKKDKMTGTTLPIPIDDWNHIIDPVRYCVRASHLYGY